MFKYRLGSVRLVDVETDKAAVTIPSPRGGTVVSTTGAPGDTVVVGQVIATIDDGTGAELAELLERRIETSNDIDLQAESLAELSRVYERDLERPADAGRGREWRSGRQQRFGPFTTGGLPGELLVD